MHEEHLPLHKIALPERLHRVALDDLALHELARSIQANGLISPISVRAINGAYELIAGHRRLAAHELLQLPTIRATVYEDTDPVNPDAVRFAENLHRADLSPMEEAKAIADYQRATGADLDQVAAMLHRSTDWCEQRLALLTMPDELTVALHQRRLPIAHALALARVTDDAHRNYLLRYALDSGATITTLRSWVQQWELARDAGNPNDAPRPALPDPGQPVVVTMPCLVCTTPYPYQQLRIVRICPTCYPHLVAAGAEASPPPGGAPGAHPTTTSSHP